MSDWIQALNDNAGVLQVLFSGLVTAATVVYAVLTWRLVTETRHMRRAQTNAKMTIALETRPEHLNLVDLALRNEGLGPAYDVRFEVADLSPDGDKEVLDRVGELGFVEHGLSYFSPNQEIRTFLVSLTDNFESKMRTRVQVKISYRTAAGEEVTDEYVLDFSVFEGIHQLGKPDLHSIAKSVEALAKDLHYLSTGFHKLQVITQDKAEHRREQEEWHEQAIEARAQRGAQNTAGSETDEA